MAGVLVPAIGVLVALVFCGIRVAIDFRARRFGWSVAGLIVCAWLLWASLTPIQTHAVKIDLPIHS